MIMMRDMEKDADDKALKKLVDVMSELMGKDVGAMKVSAVSPKVARGAEEEMGEHTIDEGTADQLAADHISKDPEAYDGTKEHEDAEPPEFEAGEKADGDDDEDEDDMRKLMEEYSKRR
jgi:hypothetical protein